MYTWININKIVMPGKLLWHKGVRHFGKLCYRKLIPFEVEAVAQLCFRCVREKTEQMFG